MTTPQDPEDESVGGDPSDDPSDHPADGIGDGLGDGLGDRLGDRLGDGLPDSVSDEVSAEDALWRSIVDNYGERPEIAEPQIEVPPSPRDLTPPPPADGDTTEPSAATEREEHFVPPVPPPLPAPPPARLLAWVGLFGVPMVVLVALVAGIVMPSWLGLILMVWFVGGFIFLVASMRQGPGEDYDDGARL